MDPFEKVEALRKTHPDLPISAVIKKAGVSVGGSGAFLDSQSPSGSAPAPYTFRPAPISEVKSFGSEASERT